MHSAQIVERGQSVEQANQALIALHGRGGSALDILNLAQQLCGPSFYIAAPQAAQHTWYPHSFMAEDHLNEPWLSSAVATVQKLIITTAQYIPLNRIYLMGFSQGACLALEVAARFATQYGGVIAFSGGLIGHTLQEKKYNGQFEGTPIFIGNSDNDPHIPLLRCQESQMLLEKLGAAVTLKIYPGMGHHINADEIDWAKKLLQASKLT